MTWNGKSADGRGGRRLARGVKRAVLGLPGADRADWTARRALALAKVRRQWRLARRRVARDPYLDLSRILWIDPRDVVGFSLSRVRMHEQPHIGMVMPGDWDLIDESRYTDTYPTVASLRAVVKEGAAWPATPFYARHVARLGSGQPGAFATVSDLEHTCAVYEHVYASVVREGYKTQRQLALGRPAGGAVEPAYEVLVGIGRTGDLLFVDGQHRFAAAYVAAVPRLPVQVGMRHPGWMEVRARVADYLQQHGVAPEPLLHPDLDDLPADADAVERFVLAAATVPEGARSAVVLGSGWGYASRQLHELGLHCVTLPRDAGERWYCDALAPAGRRSFDLLPAGAVELLPAAADVVIALDGLRGLLTPALRPALSAWLAKVEAPAMIVADDEDMVSFATETTGLTQLLLLGVVADRPVYRLTRPA